MTIVSRLQLDHPPLATAGGSALHTLIEAIYVKIGDAMPARFFTTNALADAASVDFEHNFKTAFNQVRFALFLRNTGTGELTRIDKTSSPAISAFTIAATGGFLTTKVTVTNNSGAPRDLALIAVHAPLEFDDINDVDLTTAAPADGETVVYDAANKKWKPGASGDASLKLSTISGDILTLKGGGIRFWNGFEALTYDGAGSLSTDFGGDLQVNLDSELGGVPANATHYVIAVDLISMVPEVTQTDTGRKVSAIPAASIAVIAGTLKDIDLRSYEPIGWVRSADAGNVWVGAGAAFGTYPTRFVRGPVDKYQGRTLYVAGTGGTIPEQLRGGDKVYDTLTAALAAATTGDRILLAGSFTETATVVINKVVTIEANPRIVWTHQPGAVDEPAFQVTASFAKLLNINLDDGSAIGVQTEVFTISAAFGVIVDNLTFRAQAGQDITRFGTITGTGPHKFDALITSTDFDIGLIDDTATYPSLIRVGGRYT